MRKTPFNPKVIAAILATMTIINSTAPAVYAAGTEDHAESQTKIEVEDSNPQPAEDHSNDQQDSTQSSTGNNQQDSSESGSGNDQQAPSQSSSGNDQQDSSQSSTGNNQQAPSQSSTGNNQQDPSPSGTGNNQQAPTQNNTGTQPQNQPQSQTQSNTTNNNQTNQNNTQNQPVNNPPVNSNTTSNTNSSGNQNHQSTIFDDAVDVTDQDKSNIKNEMEGEDKDLLSWLKNKDAKTKQEAMEAAKKAAEKAYQKKVEENVNKAGEVAGKLLVKIAKTNYSSKDEMADDIAKTTLELMNDTFIKNAPYVGGLLNAVIKGALEENKDDPTIQQLKKNEEQLKSIYKAINDCTLKILDKHDAEMLHKKLEKINDAAKLLDETYKNNNNSFIRSIEEQARKDDNKSVGGPLKVFERIYKTNDGGKDETTYYKNFMDFTDLILNDKNLMDGYDSFGDNSDIFGLFKQIVTNGKTDIVEFQAQRKTLTKKIGSYLNNGFDVLKFTMRYDLTKQMNYQAAAEAKLAQLNELLKYADEDKKAELREQINEYSDLCFTINDNIGRTQERLNDLEERQEALSTRIKNYEKEMEEDQTRFDNFKPAQEVTQDHLTFKAQIINDRMVYPSINEDDPNIIDYHDIYGHLVKSQYISKEYNKVDQYKVKAGNVYKAKWTEINYRYFIIKTHTAKEAMIKVTKVYEDDRLGGLYTIRTIEGIDLNTNKPIKLTLGAVSPEHATLYEKSVTPLMKADK